MKLYAMKLYEILKVKNALVKFVYYVMEYTIYNLVFRIFHSFAIYSFILEIKILIFFMVVVVVVVMMMIRKTMTAIMMIKSQACISRMFVL